MSFDLSANRVTTVCYVSTFYSNKVNKVPVMMNVFVTESTDHTLSANHCTGPSKQSTILLRSVQKIHCVVGGEKSWYHIQICSGD